MILFYLSLSISFFIIAIIIRINRNVFYNLASNSVALVNVLISDEGEDEKIDLIQKNTNKLAVSLLKMLLYLVFAFAVGSLVIVIYCILTHAVYSDLVFGSFYSILSISIGATIPFMLPGNKKKSDYSELSQLLHKLALDNYYLADKLFKRESKNIKKKGYKTRNDFVVISGLARAGTTSLMNDLATIENFVSLSYANMPFVMIPNLWSRFYKPKTEKVKERSHKDGIMIGYNSNEALEEYFFKVKANDSYVQDLSVTEYEVPKDDYSDYLDYQTNIKLDDNKLYIAKNNNFIVRYKSIRALNEDFIFVILFRDPVTHTASLFEKHKYYQKIQKDDSFVLNYMNWLGHYEFGLNQKPFVFNDLSKDFINDDKESLDFWLKSWVNYYSYVLTIQHPNTILVNYDSYCKNPKETISSILNKTGVDAKLPEYVPFNNTRTSGKEYSGELFNKAQAIYKELCSRC